MTRGIYRGDLPKPDTSGCWRPYVGKGRDGKPTRFTVGNRRDISEGEARRRLEAVRDLFSQQCSKLGISHWHGDVLDSARQIAAGQAATIQFEKGDGFKLSRAFGSVVEKYLGVDYVKQGYDEQLAQLVAATGVPPADPKHYRQVMGELAENVRQQVMDAISKITGRITEKFGPAVAEKVPSDPLEAEIRTFHEALKAYRDHIERTGDRNEWKKLKSYPLRCQDRARWLESAHADFPVFQLDLNRMEELVAHWRNRPETALGRRCSLDHSRHMIDELFRLFNWLDDQPDWKWSMPKGTKRIKRKPVALEQDFAARRVRRITSSTYTPEQLAVNLGKWWQARPSKTHGQSGVVTAIADEIKGFPRLTLKSLRKILPNAVRPEFGQEVADLAVAHSVGRSKMADRYSDKPYRKLHEAIRSLETKFAPFLEALESDK